MLTEANKMRKKLLILLSSILLVVLIFTALPKPIVIGNLRDIDWDTALEFVREKSSASGLYLGKNTCFLRWLYSKHEADVADVSYGLVLGWREGLHIWGCFRVDGVINYVEPQWMDWIWLDYKPLYTPWLIIVY